MAGKAKPKTGGRDFKKGQSGNPKGAPVIPVEVKLVKLLTWKELALACTKLLYADIAEVTRIDMDPTEPMLHKIISKALMKAHQDGNFFMLNHILDRVCDKPPPQPDGSEESRNGHAVLAAIRKVINDQGNERKA